MTSTPKEAWLTYMYTLWEPLQRWKKVVIIKFYSLAISTSIGCGSTTAFELVARDVKQDSHSARVFCTLKWLSEKPWSNVLEIDQRTCHCSCLMLTRINSKIFEKTRSILNASLSPLTTSFSKSHEFCLTEISRPYFIAGSHHERITFSRLDC